MIELANETLIALRDAPRHLPHRPNGKRLHISAVYRWIRSGVKGVVLDSIRIGGTTYTSIEALKRFGASLATPMPIGVNQDYRTRRTLQRRTDAARILESELGLPPASIPT